MIDPCYQAVQTPRYTGIFSRYPYLHVRVLVIVNWEIFVVNYSLEKFTESSQNTAIYLELHCGAELCLRLHEVTASTAHQSV